MLKIGCAEIHAWAVRACAIGLLVLALAACDATTASPVPTSPCRTTPTAVANVILGTVTTGLRPTSFSLSRSALWGGVYYVSTRLSASEIATWVVDDPVAPHVVFAANDAARKISNAPIYADHPARQVQADAGFGQSGSCA